MLRYKIIIPENLKDRIDFNLEHFPPEFSYERHNFYSLVYDIIRSDKKTENQRQWASLYSLILKKNYGYRYKDYVNYLSNRDIVRINNQYCTNNSRKYSLNADYSMMITDSSMVIEIPRKSSLFQRHNSNRVSQRRSVLKSESYLKEMSKRFYKMKFDYQSALKELRVNINTFNEKDTLQVYASLFELSDERKSFRYFNRSETNFRLHTNLTSLKSGFKRHIDSHLSMYQIDLCNSQPFLLTIILNYIVYPRNFNLVPLCFQFNILNDLLTPIRTAIQEDSKLVTTLELEVPRFLTHTSSGKWYEHLADIYNRYYQTNAFKRAHCKSLWMSIAYSSNKASDLRKHKQAFEKEYPAIFKVIRMIKKGEHNRLAISLQQLEAYLFIDQISKELVQNRIVPLTIHDCLIVEEKNLNETLSVASSIMKEYTGMAPSFTTQKLKDVELTEKIDYGEETNRLINFHSIKRA